MLWTICVISLILCLLGIFNDYAQVHPYFARRHHHFVGGRPHSGANLLLRVGENLRRG